MRVNMLIGAALRGVPGAIFLSVAATTFAIAQSIMLDYSFGDSGTVRAGISGGGMYNDRAFGIAIYNVIMASDPVTPMATTAQRGPRGTARAPISMLPTVVDIWLMLNNASVRPRNSGGE